MNFDTLIFLGIMTFLALYFLVVKLPLWLSLPIVRHPVIADIVFSAVIMSAFAAMPSVSMFAICTLAVVVISILLWVNTRYRWMEKSLLRKVNRAITECKTRIADSRCQREHDNAMKLKHSLEWTEQELHKAIREVRV